MTGPADPPIRVFLSYAHADDVVLDFIEPFTKSLKHLAFADQGRTLEIFVDRETIGWGEDWRDGIRQGIESAAIFMPIVTRQYFERPSCREELLAFYNEAVRLRATGLILPVVLLGHSYLSTESTDVASRIIADRQYKDLKETWTDGSRSATWRRTMLALAAQLVEAVTIVEQSPSATPSLLSSEAGAAEVSDALKLFAKENEQTILGMKNALATLPTVLTTSAQLLTERSPSEIRRVLMETASELLPFGNNFRNQARILETTTLKTDQVLRSRSVELKDNDLHDQLENERKYLESISLVTKPLSGAEEASNAFLAQMRPLEEMSASLRNSMRGFREGVKSLTSALRMMQNWAAIAD